MAAVDTQKVQEVKAPVPEAVYPEIVEERRKSSDGGVVTVKYARGKLLGKGGFAKCFVAVQQPTRNQYALKIVSKHTLAKTRARQKLQMEIKIHCTLRHQHVVKFERYFEDIHNAYILMELCQHNSMSELMKRRKKLAEHEVRYYLTQLVSCLRYIHHHLVIHRDLKLGNLFLDAEMNVKVGDFGLATRLEKPDDRKKTVCGTPNYIAPEILEAKRGHSFEVDVWSTGVIMYTLLIGKPPFESKDVDSTYKAILANNYHFPDHTPLNDNAKSLIRHLLQPRPENRPSLEAIMQSSFFTAPGVYLPSFLPTSALREAPPVMPPTDDTGRSYLSFHPTQPGQTNSNLALKNPGVSPRYNDENDLNAANRINNGTNNNNQKPSGNHHEPTPVVVVERETRPVAAPPAPVSTRERMPFSDITGTAPMSLNHNQITSAATAQHSTSSTAGYRNNFITRTASGTASLLGSASSASSSISNSSSRPTVLEDAADSTSAVSMRSGQTRAQQQVQPQPLTRRVSTRLSSQTQSTNQAQSSNTYTATMNTRLSSRTGASSTNPSSSTATATSTLTSNSSSVLSERKVGSYGDSKRNVLPGSKLIDKTSPPQHHSTQQYRTSGRRSASGLYGEDGQSSTSPTMASTLLKQDMNGTNSPAERRFASNYSDDHNAMVPERKVSRQRFDDLTETNSVQSSAKVSPKHTSSSSSSSSLRMESLQQDLECVHLETDKQQLQRRQIAAEESIAVTRSRAARPVGAREAWSWKDADAEKPAKNVTLVPQDQSARPQVKSAPSVSAKPISSMDITSPENNSKPCQEYRKSHSSSGASAASVPPPTSNVYSTPPEVAQRKPESRPPPGTLEAMHEALTSVCGGSLNDDSYAVDGGAHRDIKSNNQSRQLQSVTSRCEEYQPASVWVVRYVDYTSKYGLGFLLNTGSAGVYFNDNSKIVVSADGTTFQYIDKARVQGSASSEYVVQTHLLSRYPQELQKKVTLLCHFRNYLVDQVKNGDTQQGESTQQGMTGREGDNMLCGTAGGAPASGAAILSSGSNLDNIGASGATNSIPMGVSSAVLSNQTVGISSSSTNNELPFLKKFGRTRHAILFRLSNRSVQVVFFDRSEILLSSEARIVTYVNKSGDRCEMSVEEALQTGRKDIAKRLKYTKDIMYRLINGQSAPAAPQNAKQ